MALDAFMSFDKAKSEKGDVTIIGETTDAIAVDQVSKTKAAIFEIIDFKWGAKSTGDTYSEKPSKQSHGSSQEGGTEGKTPKKTSTSGLTSLGARSVTVDSFSISKPFDTASLGLFRGATVKECYWDKARVLFRKIGPDGEPFVYLCFEFTNVRIDKIDWKIASTESTDKPDEEDIDFSFDKVTIYYSPQTIKGEKQDRGGFGASSSMKTATWSRPSDTDTSP